MKKIDIQESIFNNFVKYLFLINKQCFTKSEFINNSLLLNIFGKKMQLNYFEYIIKYIFEILLTNNKIVLIKNDVYKFDSNLDIENVLKNYFKVQKNNELYVYRYVRDYINNLGTNSLLTRQNLLYYLMTTPCFYSENYIDTLRNYLEKSGYLVKATTETGAIVAGKFYVKKKIPETLSLNDLRKEYKNSLEILYPKN